MNKYEFKPPNFKTNQEHLSHEFLTIAGARPPKKINL